jgi:hypothetical protein
MITLTRVDQAQNIERFYVLDIQPTLFGEIALVRDGAESAPPAGFARPPTLPTPRPWRLSRAS